MCGLGMLAGREKIGEGTDMVTRGEDQVRDEASRTRVLLPSDFESIRDALILCTELALVSSWGWCVCPSDCSLKETIVVGLERVSSWGHERGPSACLSKRVARIAGLARVAPWGKTHCLALDEAGLGVCGVGGERVVFE